MKTLNTTLIIFCIVFRISAQENEPTLTQLRERGVSMFPRVITTDSSKVSAGFDFITLKATNANGKFSFKINEGLNKEINSIEFFDPKDNSINYIFHVFYLDSQFVFIDPWYAGRARGDTVFFYSPDYMILNLPNNQLLMFKRMSYDRETDSYSPSSYIMLDSYLRPMIKLSFDDYGKVVNRLKISYSYGTMNILRTEPKVVLTIGDTFSQIIGLMKSDKNFSLAKKTKLKDEIALYDFQKSISLLK
ncbi:MAG TPA: hypothetical protein DGG95_00675 [Cytophagales bacterium]|jgi:hypothetical protein|nr:hypothetical protein [Cytophagales bacterium]